MISSDVCVKLLLPEVAFAFRHGGELAPCMSVPEATVYENSRFKLWEHNIRTARKVLAVQSESIAGSVQH
jgi:hypothetical protein